MASTLTADRAASAAELGVPETFNLAGYLADRHVREGRGERPALFCGDETVTYAQLAERSNRLGNALRALGVQAEQRVFLLLLDGPAFVYGFLGAMKIGAVPIPGNTLLKPQDYAYMLRDSRAVAAIVSPSLLPQVLGLPEADLPHLRWLLVDGPAVWRASAVVERMARAPPELAAEPVSRDDAAFWLYSSGTTGFPKGAVHLHHDAVVTVELYAKGVLGINAADRAFSVAKLFFA